REQCRRLHDLSGLAVTALRDVQLAPGALHGMRAVGAESFNRDDAPAGECGERRLARADGLAVDVHRAGAAESEAAAVLRARQRELVAEIPEQGHVRIAIERAIRAVDVECDHPGILEAKSGRPPEAGVRRCDRPTTR